MTIPPLYLVTDRNLLCGKDLIYTVEEAVRGGVGIVQLREKECSTSEFISLARALKAMLDIYDVPLLINDRVDVAIAVDAAGVHLGQSDMDVSTARFLLAPGKIVGLSVESRAQVFISNDMDVDYIGISPVFSTPTKTDTVIAWGIDGIRWIKNNSRHRLVAIGGINTQNAADIFAAGADSIAVVSGIISADDPRSVSQDFLKVIE